MLRGMRYRWKAWLRIAAVGGVLVLAGCGGGDGDAPAATGTITPPAYAQLDGDSNDPRDPVRPDGADGNDTRDDAQTLSNPATVGGYLRAADHELDSGELDAGARFADEPDPEDWYRVTLAEGQGVNLLIAENDAGKDFDLALIDASDGDTVATSMSSNDPADNQGAMESLEAPADGDYWLQVSAVSGAGNYVLRLGRGVEPLRLRTMRAEADFVPGQLVIRFRDAPLTTSADAESPPGRARLYEIPLGVRAFGADARGTLGSLAIADEALRRKAETIVRLKEMRRDPDVVWASVNHRLRPQATANDPDFVDGRQGYLDEVGFRQAWDELEAANAGDVVLAVVDTGVIDHSDLVANLTLDLDTLEGDGYDFVEAEGGPDPDPTDPDPDEIFHGTYVAGIAAADTNNDKMMAGAAGPMNKVRIMPVRALGADGGTEYDVLQAVRYAAGLSNDSGTVPARPADVINLSLGGGAGEFEEAFREGRDEAEVVLVAAAGNGGENRVHVPAVYDGVVAVGASDGLQRASFSNFGDHLDVMAPGVSILGLCRENGVDGTASPDAAIPCGDTVPYSGTSMATPQVAAAAALMKSVWPGMTPQDFDCALAAQAITENLAGSGWDEDTGYGRIDAERAVQQARKYADDASELTDQVFASPRTLDFGGLLDELTLAVDIPCSDDVEITAVSPVTDDGGDWLSIEKPDNARGVGDYRVRVDRDAMPENDISARATITFVADGSESVEVDVIALTAPSVGFALDAGTLYAQLRAAATDQVVEEVRLRPGESGLYRFRFEDVDAGEYYVVAGSDRDYDGAIGDPGEVFGAWPRASNIETFSVDGDGRSGLDFDLGYRDRLGTQVRRQGGRIEIEDLERQR